MVVTDPMRSSTAAPVTPEPSPEASPAPSQTPTSSVEPSVAPADPDAVQLVALDPAQWSTLLVFLIVACFALGVLAMRRM